MTERELLLDWNRITPSERQLSDAAGIVAVQGASLNHAYLHEWAKELEVEKVVDDLLQLRIRPKTT